VFPSGRWDQQKEKAWNRKNCPKIPKRKGYGMNSMFSLKVNNIAYDVTKDIIEAEFGKFGEIDNIYFPQKFHRGRKSNRGISYIRYKKRDDMELALHNLNGKNINGRHIKVIESTERPIFTSESVDNNELLNVEELVRKKISWCICNGIMVSIKTKEAELLNKYASNHAPFSLYPYNIPYDAFENAIYLAPLFNILIDKISRKPEWLISKLHNTGMSDPFVSKLLDIYKTVNDEGIRQKVYLGINRSDYMLHNKEGDSRKLLQVEINTIASSFGSLSTKISDMYRIFDTKTYKNIPKNPALHRISDALVTAASLYNRQKSLKVRDSQIVMVVSPGEFNFVDQRHLEFEIASKYYNKVQFTRASLLDINDNGIFDSESGDFRYKGKIVSVFYFRTGYTPEDHPTEIEWNIRLQIERSNAIKCPNIGYHLAGCKKIQQVLANPGEVENFISSASECNSLRNVFAGLYNLDESESGSETLQLVNKIKIDAILNPENYVLKPQREGGGNNIYGDNLKEALNTFSPVELAAYILMEKILPLSQISHFIRDGKCFMDQSICELGIYGIYLGEGNTESYNYQNSNKNLSSSNSNIYAGHLLRVKPVLSNEGGVAAGYSVLAAPNLIRK
jgi:glutathione synthase